MSEHQKSRIIEIMHKWGSTEPEDGESWESWFSAAFELMTAEVSETLASKS